MRTKQAQYQQCRVSLSGFNFKGIDMSIGLGSYQEIVHPEYFNADIDKQNKIRETLIDADLDGKNEDDEQGRYIISRAIENEHTPCYLTKDRDEFYPIPEDGKERSKQASAREIAIYIREGILSEKLPTTLS